MDRNACVVGLFGCIFVIVAGCANAGDPNHVPALPPIPTITSEQLHARLADRQPTVILDVRERNEYDEVHIAGAVWFPKSRFDRDDPQIRTVIDSLAGDDFIVVHCGAGHRSSYVTRKLRGAGYDAHNLDGISFWIAKGYPVVRGPKGPPSSEPAIIHLEEAYQHYYLLFEDVVWIDVREACDYAAGHITGAISIPLSDLEDNLHRIPRDREIVLYCQGTTHGRSCTASLSAGRTLLQRGYSPGKIKVFEDGPGAWKAAGYPTESKPFWKRLLWR